MHRLVTVVKTGVMVKADGMTWFHRSTVKSMECSTSHGVQLPANFSFILKREKDTKFLVLMAATLAANICLKICGRAYWNLISQWQACSRFPGIRNKTAAVWCRTPCPFQALAKSKPVIQNCTNAQINYAKITYFFLLFLFLNCSALPFPGPGKRQFKNKNAINKNNY